MQMEASKQQAREIRAAVAGFFRGFREVEKYVSSKMAHGGDVDRCLGALDSAYIQVDGESAECKLDDRAHVRLVLEGGAWKVDDLNVGELDETGKG